MKKTWKIMAFALVTCMLCLCFSPCNVEAGLSRIVVDSSSYAEELNTAVWNIPEKDITVQDGALYFSADSTKYTRLITKSMVTKTEEAEELVSASFALNLKSMPENGEFILGFGLANIESFSGEQGQVEVVFANNGGIQMAVRSYENAGQAVNIVEPQAAGFRLGSKAKVAVTIKNDKTMTIAINNKTVASKVLSFDAEGSVGFFQTGGCEVLLSDVTIQSTRYDRPENSNFTEKFDEDKYNANLLFSKAASSGYAPSTMSVEEYENDYVMWYENSGLSQIGTTQQYSNFELTFDVPYLLRKNIEDENGNTLHAKSMWVGVSFGDEAMEYDGYGYDYSPEMVYFDHDSAVKSYAQNNKVVGQSEQYKFFDENETRGFSVKVAVVDANVTIGIKWIDEEQFTTLADYEMASKQTPLGYVHIWTCGPGNFAIDNIEMKNLDTSPNLVDVEYKTSKFEVPANYEYKESEMVFRETEGEEAFSGGLIILGVTVLGIAMVGISLVIAKKKSKKAEGGYE